MQVCATHHPVSEVQLNSKEEMDGGWRDLCSYGLVLLLGGAQL